MELSRDSALYLALMVLGVLVAIAPWTFAPVCAVEMRCWTTRDVETVLGLVIAVVSLYGLFKGLE